MSIADLAAKRGYGENADEFEDGYTARGNAAAARPLPEYIRYPGPQRLAFQAGWNEKGKELGKLVSDSGTVNLHITWEKGTKLTDLPQIMEEVRDLLYRLTGGSVIVAHEGSVITTKGRSDDHDNPIDRADREARQKE
jgi:hypothetical protein